MSQIPDFMPEEIKAVNDTLAERYDSELRLNPDDSQVTECPALYWDQGGCHFILARTGDSQFYSQFFYGAQKQFGTGRHSYSDLLDCLVTTRVQADHELQPNKVKDLNQ